MIYDPRRRALELRQRIIESMTAEELEEYAKTMAERESPLDILIRTAKDFSDESYYHRKDNIFQVPRGVMNRLISAIEKYENGSAKKAAEP